MIVKQVIEFLNGLHLGDKDRSGSLRHLAFLIDDNKYKEAKYANKEHVVSILSTYYCTPNRFEQLWSSLSDAERKIISLHIWGGGSEPADCADAVAEEFGVTKKKDKHYWYSYNGLDKYKGMYAGAKSLIWLLFPSHNEMYLFRRELRDAVGEIKRIYSSVSNTTTFLTRESRTTDFINTVRFCNSNKLKVTKNGILSKTSAAKLRDFCGYEEYAAEINAKPENMRTTDRLLVTFPLTVLCVIGGLLTTAEGEYIPVGKSLALINLPHEQLVQKLFEAYLKSKTFNEINLMKGIQAKRGHNPAMARQNLVTELKCCPVGQFVYTKEFELYLRIANKTFARKEDRHVVETRNYYYDYEITWEQYEHSLINIILSFFCALGIVDIIWKEDDPKVYAGSPRIPIAFRINCLGAYILGLAESYAAPTPKAKIQGGFTVLPDHTIIVPDSLDRLKHELYFERLFTKVSSTDEAAIYRLDFETVVRAINSGSNVTELHQYLSASDKPLPRNVARSLDDWQKQSERIRLRQVTILECDDDALLEEVIRYRGMGELVKEKIAAAVVVDDNGTSKIKKVIEKNKRFCKDVI